MDTSKEWTVTFAGQVTDGIPWKFYPLQPSVDVYPGETVLAFYRATNTSDEPILGFERHFFPFNSIKELPLIQLFLLKLDFILKKLNVFALMNKD